MPQNEKRTSKVASEPSPTPPQRKSIAVDAIEKYEKQVGFNRKQYVEGLGRAPIRQNTDVKIRITQLALRLREVQAYD